MVSEREWHRWANCRPNSLKINMVSRDTAKTSTVCQPIPVSYLQNNWLPFFLRPGSATQYTGSNGSNILKHDGQISSLTFQMYLISFTGLFNWMRKRLQGQRTDAAFQNRALFMAEARRWAYHRTNCLRAQKAIACQRPVCQHIMVPLSETLTAPRVRFCSPALRWTRVSEFVFEFVSHPVKKGGRHQSRHVIIDLEQNCQAYKGYLGQQVMWMMENVHNMHLKHNWRSTTRQLPATGANSVFIVWFVPHCQSEISLSSSALMLQLFHWLKLLP